MIDIFNRILQFLRGLFSSIFPKSSAQKNPEETSSKLKAFALHFNGTIAFPGSESYKQSIAIDNGRITYSPIAILYPLDAVGISQAVKATKDLAIHMTVLNGGHNAVGWCLNDGGVVLHLKHMDQVEVDAANALVTYSGGALWQHVYETLSDSEFVAIGGGVLDVGVSGFNLGGGYSYLSRSKGLGIDNIVALEVVTADGEILQLSNTETAPHRADLFWALCGGGGGNFGIVTRITSRLHPRVKDLMAGVLSWDIDKAKEVLMVFREWVMQVPIALDPLVLLSKGANPGDPEQLMLVCFYNGPYEEGLEIMQPILDLDPKTNALERTDFYGFINKYGNVSSSQSRPAYIKASTLKQTMSENFIDHLIAGIKSAPGFKTEIVVEYAGGVIAEVAPTDTAFFWRDIVARWEIKATWEDRSTDQANIDWANSLAEMIKPESYGADVNQQDPYLKDWKNQYYGDNLERLQSIKQTWDPDNYFHFPQSV